MFQLGIALKYETLNSSNSELSTHKSELVHLVLNSGIGPWKNPPDQRHIFSSEINILFEKSYIS